MKHAILDTNFILTCARNKIDFFEELNLMGIKITIPVQVIKEIKAIADSNKKLRFREDAELGLRLLEKTKFQKSDLNSKNVDKGIINFAKLHPDYFVATLDREIKSKTPNLKIVVRQKKKLEII